MAAVPIVLGTTFFLPIFTIYSLSQMAGKYTVIKVPVVPVVPVATGV